MCPCNAVERDGGVYGDEVERKEREEEKNTYTHPYAIIELSSFISVLENPQSGPGKVPDENNCPR